MAVSPTARLARALLAHRWFPLATLLAAAAGLHLFMLVRSPAVFVDEGWYASRAWGLLQTGRNFGPLDAGVAEHFDGYWTYFPLLGTWLQAQAIRVLGLSLFAARLPSLLCGLVLLVAIYAIGHHLIGRGGGLLAALLVALSDAFFYSSHSVRQDMIVAVCGFGAIALYLTDRGRGFTAKSVLSGLAVGLAFEIHPNAALYGPPLVALYLLDYRGAVLRTRRFWGFVLGVAAGLSGSAAIHLVRYPQTFFALAALIFGSSKTPPALALDPQVWLDSLSRTLVLPQLPLGFPAAASDFEAGVQALYAVAVRATAVLGLFAPVVLGLGRGWSPATKKVFLLCEAILLTFVALVPYKREYYAIHLTPAISLMLAAFLMRIPSLAWPRWSVNLLAASVWAVALASPLLGADRLRADARLDYQAALRPMQQVIPPEATVMGSGYFWLDLRQRRYFVWQELTYYRRYVPGSTLADGLRAYRPDYLILDGNTDWHTSDHPEQYEPWAQLLYLPKQELTEFLAHHTTLVDETQTESFGDVRVYRINWEQDE